MQKKVYIDVSLFAPFYQPFGAPTPSFGYYTEVASRTRWNSLHFCLI